MMYVKEIVRPNYVTGKAEREKFEPPKSKNKSKELDIKTKKYSKPITSRPILKSNRATLTIGVHSAPYVNRYFKDELEEAKSIFFE